MNKIIIVAFVSMLPFITKAEESVKPYCGFVFEAAKLTAYAKAAGWSEEQMQKIIKPLSQSTLQENSIKLSL